MTRNRRPPVALLALLAALLVGSVVAAPVAEAYAGAPWFRPDHPYTENFPDPSIYVDRASRAYYAYATTTGGSYVPVARSTDARTWTARSAYPQPACVGGRADPFFNDAFPCPAPWAPDMPWASGRLRKEIWAPGVARVGGHHVMFYAVRDRVEPPHYCIAVATSAGPEGPFSDARGGCFHADPDPKGSIDPQPFVDDDGTPYLIWKSEGVPGSQPTRIWGRQLDAAGTGWAPGSARHLLLQTSQGWEGNVIENPAMVRYQGRLYLFYSANEWDTAAYATGYAVCSTPLGGCSKWGHNPVLASRGDRLGPGGPAPLVDLTGRLLLGYHYWRAPVVGYPAYPGCDGDGDGVCDEPDDGQRRMAVDMVQASGDDFQVTGPPTVPIAPRDIDDSCPEGEVRSAGFDDTAGNAHQRAIDCIVTRWRIADGLGPGRYDPLGVVTRGQMAKFLFNMIVGSGGSLPEPRRDWFRDDDGSPFEDHINALAEARVVSGVADDQYAPRAGVTRAQMATFLAAAYERRAGEPLPEGPDAFVDDDGTFHERNINRIAGARITGGRGDGSYGVRAFVLRDQMASFLARTLDLLVEQGEALPPT